jgi:CHAT domain-containing protein
VARRSEWLAAIESLPSKLSQLVGAALDDGLRASGVERNGAVLWLPQGALGLLPVAIASGGTAGDALIDDYTFSTAPSLAAAETSLRRAKAPPGRPTLTAVVNPTGDLAFTEPEGAVAASHFEAARRSLFGAEDARSVRVLAALAKSNHWHFATHGTFSWMNAADSALMLAADDRLTIRTILDRSDLGHPRLVILSACETGVFDFRRTPDEFIGLPVAFLQAGASGVIGSLWPVDDVSTALIMMKFYELYLAKGAPPATALRHAQLWLRDATRDEIVAFLADMQRSGRLLPQHEAQLTASLGGGSGDAKPFNHPFYWAAFQFYGS